VSTAAAARSTAANRSYREVLLRNPRMAGLLAGDLLATAGTGMLIVAMPVQTLSLHAPVAPALAIGLVEAAPFVLSTVLALMLGLGRFAVSPRRLLVADCLLRAAAFTALGVTAVTGRLTLPVLVAGLLLGSTCRMAGAGSRRLLATSMVDDPERFAVNGLLGLGGNLAQYVLGPVAGGLLVGWAGAGWALFADACGALVLLAAVLRCTRPATASAPAPARAADWPASVPAGADDASGPDGTDDASGPDGANAARAVAAGRASGWRILRRRPVAARLLVVVFFFNFLYMPIEVALPLYVRGTLHGGASGLGLLWTALGVGALLGAALVDRLRHVPQRPLLLAIIALWALCPVALAAVRTQAAAMAVFGLGGLVWAPFTPLAYSFLQSELRPDEQQPVVTLWTTGSSVAAPLGLLAAGPLVAAAGTRAGLVLSGLLTLLLAPVAAWGVLTGRDEPAAEGAARAPS
jgi:MFS family permease